MAAGFEYEGLQQLSDAEVWLLFREEEIDGLFACLGRFLARPRGHQGRSVL